MRQPFAASQYTSHMGINSRRATKSSICKRASASRRSGQWSDDDFDVLAEGVVVGRIFKANTAPVGEPWMWPLDAAPLIRIHGQHPTGALHPRSVGAVTLKAFACSRALAFYRPSIGWSKLGLAVGGRSGDAVWLRRLLRRSEPLGAQPSFHLHYDAPQSEQTRSRPSTASIEAPLHSASATQIGPLETTTQTRGLTFASPMGRSHATYHQQL
jgi:hypothetical protein